MSRTKILDGIAVALLLAVIGLPLLMTLLAPGQSMAQAVPTSTLSLAPLAPPAAPLSGKVLVRGSNMPITLDNASQVKPLTVLEWDQIDRLAWSPDSQMIVASINPGLLWLDVPTMTVIQNLKTERGVYAVAFSQDRSTVASGGADSAVSLWDVKSGHLNAALKAVSTLEITAIAFSPDGKVMAVSDGAGDVRLWNAATLQPMATLSGHKSLVSGLKFSPDSSMLASVSQDNTIRLWDIQSGQLRTLFKYPAESFPTDEVLFIPDQSLLYSADINGRVLIWDLKTGQLVTTRQMGGELTVSTNMAFSPDGSLVASHGIISQDNDEKAIQLWDVQTGKLKAILHGHTQVVTVLAFSPDGTRIASGGYDKTLRIWGIPAP